MARMIHTVRAVNTRTAGVVVVVVVVVGVVVVGVVDVR
jgi:hypothetical protein